MNENIWAPESIDKALHGLGLTHGVDASLPTHARFIGPTRKLLLEAAKEHNWEQASPTVFLLHPGGLIQDDPNHESRLTGKIDPLSRAWIVGEAVRSGVWRELPGDSANEVFKFVCETLELGSAPAIYFDPSHDPDHMSWYPTGLSQPDDCFESALEQHDVPSLDDLVDVVDRVHRSHLMTSFNQVQDTTLWENGTKYWAKKNAEQRVQSTLLAGLTGAFGHPFFVEQEVSGKSGRFDIGFLEHTGAGATQIHAILELKVARSRGSNGKKRAMTQVEADILSGVEQARSYADERMASSAACLVFDLRTEEDTKHPPDCEARASQLGVLLKAWRCFPTAKHYREFTLPTT